VKGGLVAAAAALAAVAAPAAVRAEAAAGDAVAEGGVTTEIHDGRRDRVVSVPLVSLQGLAGVAARYEALVPGRRWSLGAGTGLRAHAGGDYRSMVLSAGGEARYWLSGRAVLSDLPARSMVGWFTGGRLDVAWTRTTDRVEDRSIGDNLALAATATFGYRIAARGRVEITPAVGLGVTSDLDLRGRLSPWTRPVARLGLTVGWMF
jgi:hypothetical protein